MTRPKPPKSAVLRARRRLALDLAETIRDDIHKVHGVLPDEDAIAETILCWLPLSIAEAQAEWDEMESMDSDADSGDAEKPQPGPSILDQLRAALGHDRGCSLRGTMERAIEVADQHGALQRRVAELEQACEAALPILHAYIHPDQFDGHAARALVMVRDAVESKRKDGAAS